MPTHPLKINHNDSDRPTNALFLFLAAIGIVLRSLPYFDNHSFWGDEAWVALELLRRSPTDIITNSNLNPTQALPQIGFIVIEKSLVTLFGMKEYVFRFFPWLCGILGCYFFAQLSRRMLPWRAALMATAFFVLSENLIYYSSQLKPYSSDALFAILLTSAYIDARQNKMNTQSVVWLQIWGAIALFFSLSNAIILLSILLIWGRLLTARAKNDDILRFLRIAGTWVLFFLILFFYYGSTLKLFLTKEYLSSICLMWPSSMDQFPVLGQRILGILNDPVGLLPISLTALIFLWGCVSWWRKDRSISSLFLLPIAITLALSLLGKFPVLGRLLLFLLPAFYLLIAEGLNAIMGKSLWRTIAGLVIFTVLLIQPVTLSLRKERADTRINIRSAVFYLLEHISEEDSLYLNNETQWGFWFYSSIYQINKPLKINDLICEPLGHDSNGDFVILDSFLGPYKYKVYAPDRMLKIDKATSKTMWTQLPHSGRTWVLLSQIPLETETFFTQCLDRRWKRLQKVKSRNVSLYLYDLDEPE